jgi:hypothetical protein
MKVRDVRSAAPRGAQAPVRAPGAGIASAAAGLGLGLLALGPGLRRGFLLSYDMVFVPREPFSAALPGLAPPRTVPSDLVIAAASRILPADIVQKAVLLAIFVLAASGAAALLDREPLLARLAAGVFYAWNPYVAERLIIGQWALLLGYAGLPWVLRAVLARDPPSWRGAARLALALLPAAIGGFAAMTVTALVLVPAALLTRNGRTAGVALTGLALGALPWLIPALLHPVYVDPASVAAFAARADTPFGSVGSLLMLGGAWNAQTVPKAYGGAWSALWLAVVIAGLAGYYLAIARSHPPARGPGGYGGRAAPRAGGPWGSGGKGFPPGSGGSRGVAPPGLALPGLGVAAIAGLVIACLGVTAPGRELLRSMIGAWPGFAVLRDAQQFVAPLALAEAAGFGVAVAWVMNARTFGLKGGPRERAGALDAAGAILGVVAILAPVLLLPGLAWGAAGRLRPAAYPAGWLAAARMIDASPARGDVLILPWETYRTPAWNHGEVVLDPWSRLLSRPVIWNDGTRVGGVELAPDDPRARRLDGVIRGGGPLTAALAAAGVRFVVDDPDGPGPQGPQDQQVRARLPGAVVLVDQPGLTVYQLPG